MWVADGGFAAGLSHGASDELGWDVIDKPTTIHDLHATILHLLGFDHEALTWRHSGREFRLTDTAGTVLRPLLA